MLLFILTACATTVRTPDDFITRDISTSYFTLRTIVRDSVKNAPVNVYIEGDGYSFNMRGRPTADPTPRSAFMRGLAFNDIAPNVAYVARPCQYVADSKCVQSDWTTARFSKRAVDSTADAIRQIAVGRDVILIGFSGGAQIAGLVAVLHPDIHVKKLITIAGNLDHAKWTRENNLMPLSDSLDLNDYRNAYLKIPQMHYVGENDEVVSPHLTRDFVGDDLRITIVPNAGHN